MSVLNRDAAARTRAFAAMERAWGKAKVEATGSGRLALTFRRGPLVVRVGDSADDDDADDDAPFVLTLTRR